MNVEYKVRKIRRYVVTRYHEEKVEGGNPRAGCDTRGEYENPQIAFAVAYALAKGEHDKLGYPPGDERIQYPKEVASENFSVSIKGVLDGAADADLTEVALVGRDATGALYVASSVGTPQTLQLFEQAAPEIDRIAST